VGDVQHDQSTYVPGHGNFVRHPVRATVQEVAHRREIADEGANSATPAIVVGAVLAFVVPFVAILILLVFGIADIS
jgi:hypothetical protein